MTASPLLAAALLIAEHPAASALTYRVPSDYPTIQLAVSAVPSQLTVPITIEVAPGTYRERVSVNLKHGTATNPLIIRAVGAVIVDGSDDLTGLWTPYSAQVWSAPVAFSGGSSENQLFIGDSRSTYVSSSPDSLQPGQYTFTGTTIFTYGDPGSQPSSVSARTNGFVFNTCDHVTLAGFTTLRTRAQGIQIQGTSATVLSTFMTVVNCTSAFNWRQGIGLRFTSNCSLLRDTTYANVRHGIYIVSSDHCQVTGNLTYANEDPAPTRDGITGIKVGDTKSTSDVSDVTVDANVAHDNEDTGIDIAGAQRVLVRRNVSYRNRDHGYDNNYTDNTVYLNDVAARNDHDGMSIELSATNVRIYNCILAGNTINPWTLGMPGKVRELYVANTNGFASDHNILVGIEPTGELGGGYGRYLVEFPCGPPCRYPRWSDYRVNQPSYDASSYSSDPMFADSTNGNFIVNSSASDAVDSGKSDATGWLTPFWLSTDPRGFAPHDVAAVVDRGEGSIAYADIGAFEFDARPAAVSDLAFDVDPVDCTKFWLTWRAHSDDEGLPASGPTLYEMRISGQPFADWTGGTGVPLGLAPAMPPAVQRWPVTVSAGQTRYVGIGTKDLNGQWSRAGNVVLISGPPLPFSDLGEGGGTFVGGGDGDIGFRTAPVVGRAAGESTPTRFALRQNEPNPFAAATTVRFDLPVGATARLEVFDLQGRRVKVLADRSFPAGRHAVLWDRRDETGVAARPGVYSYRLAAGTFHAQGKMVLLP